jgi:hypothetical protein
MEPKLGGKILDTTYLRQIHFKLRLQLKLTYILTLQVKVKYIDTLQLKLRYTTSLQL